jgi:hypothetical protein
MYGKDHSGGWSWANKKLEEILENDEILVRAAADVIRKNQDDMAPFWLAKFLWDVFYGNGCPFVRRVDMGALTPVNFEHCDFMSLMCFIMNLEVATQ